MGMCEFPLIKRKNSISIEEFDNKNNNNLTKFPKGEFFFSKSSFPNQKTELINKNYEKIELYLNFNNKKYNPNSSFKIRTFICNHKPTLKDEYNLIGETEEIKGKDKLTFSRGFLIDYHFEKHQYLKLDCIENDNLIYTTEVKIGNLMSSQESTFIIPIKAKNSNDELLGELYVNGNQTRKNCNISNFDIELKVNFHIKSNNSKNSNNNNTNNLIDLVTKEKKLFYTISSVKNNDNGRYIYKSNDFFISPKESIYSNSFKIRTTMLYTRDQSEEIKFQIFEWKNDDNTTLLAFTTVKIIDLNANKNFNGVTLLLKTYNKQNDKDGMLGVCTFGKMTIKYTESKICSFLDYIKGGMQMNLSVAIDFSNKNFPFDNSSCLHCVSNDKSSPYQRIIHLIGEIVEQYDIDKLFPIYGIGGKFKESKDNNEYFSLDNNKRKGKLKGNERLLYLYKENLNKIEQKDNINISPIINQTIEKIKIELEEGINKYYILLILISQSCQDIEDVKKSVVYASEYPISIILIGIGNESFKTMEVFNGRAPIVNPQEEQCKRNMTQFVMLNEFDNNNKEGYLSAEEYTLQEIPEQVEEYYEMQKGIKFSLLSSNK